MVDAIIDRMVIAPEAGSQAEMLRIIGISNSLASAWKRRGKVPDGSLAKVAERTGVRLEWLKTGEGEMRAQAAALDPETLQAVIEAVEEHLQSNKQQMAPAKKAELIVTLYEMFSEDENKQIDKKTVAKLIRLAS